RRRSPDGSLNGIPVACTRVPGAWLAMSRRADAPARITGRGSCGSGLPSGSSMHMRQARISASSCSSERCARGAVTAPGYPSPSRHARRHGADPEDGSACQHSSSTHSVSLELMTVDHLKQAAGHVRMSRMTVVIRARSEEHTSELQSRENLVCRLLLEKKKKKT